MPMINFRAGEDLAEALRARAGDDDVALSALIRRACQELLDREDGDWRAQVAKRVEAELEADPDTELVVNQPPQQGIPVPTENHSSLPGPPAPRHLHRFAATGAFRHEQGQRIDERRCACGEVTWS